MLVPSYAEYSQTRKTLHEEEVKILNQEGENEFLREQNHRLQHDPRAIERVAREKFGWSEKGEKIYDYSR